MIAHSSQADLSAVWWWWFFSGREDARIPRCIQSYAWVADLACKVNFHLWHLCISLSCFGWLVHPLFCSGFVAAPKVLLLFNLRFQSNGWVLAPAWKYRLKAVSTLCSIIYIYIYIILLMAHASLCDSYAWRCPSRNTWLLLAPCPAHAQSIVFCSSPLTPFQSMKYWSLSFFLMCVLPRLHRRNSQVFVCWRQRTQGLKRYGLLEVFTIWIPFVVLISSTASKWTQLMDKVW